jgi:hypothetical protein
MAENGKLEKENEELKKGIKLRNREIEELKMQLEDEEEEEEEEEADKVPTQF